jgi:hypothetical protein
MAKKSIYELNYSFEALDIKKSEMLGKPITEYFEEGKILVGEYYKKDYILVDDRYVFPLEYLSKSEKMPYLKRDSDFDETIDRIKAQSVILSEREKEKLDEAGFSIKSTIEGKKAEEVKKVVQECMTTTEGWDVPLTAGIDGPLENWGQKY